MGSDKEFKVKVSTESDVKGIKNVERELANLRLTLEVMKEKLLETAKDGGADFDGLIDYTNDLKEEITETADELEKLKEKSSLKDLKEEAEAAAGNGNSGVSKIGKALGKLKSGKHLVDSLASSFLRFAVGPLGLAAAGFTILFTATKKFFGGLKQLQQNVITLAGKPIENLVGKMDDLAASEDEATESTRILTEAQRLLADATSDAITELEQEEKALKKVADATLKNAKAKIDLQVLQGELATNEADKKKFLTADEAAQKKFDLDKSAGQADFDRETEFLKERHRLKKLAAIEAKEAVKLATQEAAAKKADFAALKKNPGAARDPKITDEIRFREKRIRDIQAKKYKEPNEVGARLEGAIDTLLNSPDNPIGALNEISENVFGKRLETPSLAGGGLADEDVKVIEGHQDALKDLRQKGQVGVDKKVGAKEAGYLAAEKSKKAAEATAEAADKEEDQSLAAIGLQNVDAKQVHEIDQDTADIRNKIRVKKIPKKETTPQEQLDVLASDFSGGSSNSTTAQALQQIKQMQNAAKDGIDPREAEIMSALFQTFQETLDGISVAANKRIDVLQEALAAVESRERNSESSYE